MTEPSEIATHWETLKEGAWRLGVCKNTIVRWAKTNRIPCQRINQRVVFYDLSNPPELKRGGNPKSKLRKSEVDTIMLHRCLGYGAGSKLARLFQVSPWTIYGIWHGKTWNKSMALKNGKETK